MVKLYKDSVEDKIKENVAVGGQEWDSPSRAEVSSSSAVQEGICNTNSIILLRKKNKQLFNDLGVTLRRKVQKKLHFETGETQSSTQLLPNINSRDFNSPA